MTVSAAVAREYVEACAADVEAGGHEDLAATIDLIDASLLAAMADTPELWELARELRQDAERRAKALEEERAIITRARKSGDARLIAALKWFGPRWRSAFSSEVAKTDTAAEAA
jgi:hypothetical protein